MALFLPYGHQFFLAVPGPQCFGIWSETSGSMASLLGSVRVSVSQITVLLGGCLVKWPLEFPVIIFRSGVLHTAFATPAPAP